MKILSLLAFFVGSAPTTEAPTLRSLSTGFKVVVPNTSPVPGSQLLATAYSVTKGSATEKLSTSIIALEKAVEGIGPDSKVSASQAKEVKRIVSGILDIESLGERSLVNYWAELGKTKKGLALRKKYVGLFRELVEENYLEKARKYIGGKYRIPLLEEKKGARGPVIFGRIQKADVDVELEFRFQETKAGLKVADILLDQTSLEGTYRSSFNRIIRKHGGLDQGMPELLAVMERRLTDLKSGRATTL